MASKTDMNDTTLSSSTAPPQSAPVMAPSVSPKGSVVPLPSDASETPSELGTRWSDDPRIPSFLASMIVHTILLVILALFTYRGPAGISDSLFARQGDAVETVILESLPTEQKDAVIDGTLAEETVAVVISPSEPIPVASPIELTDFGEMETKPGELASSGGITTRKVPLLQLPSGGGLGGRTPEGRLELGRKYGATKASEEAVEAALKWLAEHQRRDGSWSFNLKLDPCNGQCRHSKKEGDDSPTPTTGATGLALLAFLGAGHTHHIDGPYQETVRRGVYYLRGVAAETHAGYDWQKGSMYGHGIALMALAEALKMTSDGDPRSSDLYDLVYRGASFTCIAQHDSGSWGYVPGRPGDTTVSGWQVLSLIAAKKNGIPLHTDTLPKTREFLLSACTDRDYWFGYKKPPGEPTTTAIGLTLMLYLGESPLYTPFHEALTNLANRGPTLNNIYHDYYGTLALHHSRHRDWDRWNTKLRDHLVKTQAQSGHEKGSWHFKDRWGDVGGRLYTTAMCAMTLEVYYRYLPLYENAEFTLD